MATLTATYTLPLSEIDRADLAVAGGKGANLGAMVKMGLPVPPGFCVTAETYRSFVAGAKPAIQAALAGLNVDDTAALEDVSRTIREAIESLPIPGDIADAIGMAYADLGERGG